MMHNNEDSKAEVHLVDNDFDAPIQEDEARALAVDPDDVHFSPEAGSKNFQNIDIDTPASNLRGSLSDNAGAKPASPIEHAHSESIVLIGTFAVITALLVIAMVLRRIILRRRAKKRLGKEVFKYILDFDVEDVDLTRAVTGGWHGTYKNNLREGISTDSDTDDFDTDDDFDDDLYSDEEEDADDVAFFNASRRIQEAHENMIVFEEEKSLRIGERNIFLKQEVDAEEVYHNSSDNVFSAVSA